ncbi:MAG TPA: PilZ domain-containing protein [Chloroflexota bacterium]|nr:PilZ domain-containing protein [Chloroflexota bacterium]
MERDEKRRFFRTNCDLPATLFLQSEDFMKRPVTIFNLSGSGCAVRFQSTELIAGDETHQLSFELPNRPQPMEFDCALVSAMDDGQDGQELRLQFIKPRGGLQDAIVTYVQNRKRYESTAFKVAIPVAIEAQGGLRAGQAYKGTTLEVGKDYALCELGALGLTSSSEVIATFQAPHFRDELFFPSIITKVERNGRGGYFVRVLLNNPGDQMLEFVRHHYSDKAKAMQITPAR